MRLRQWTIFAMALFAAAGALAVEPRSASIDELMHKSGLWIQLAEIAPTFAESLDEALAEIPDADENRVAALGRAFATAYGPDRLRPAVARQLALSMSPADVDAALEWLGGDLGKRITRLEEDASTTAAMRARRTTGAQRVETLPPDRLARYEKLAHAIHAGDVGAMVLINITAGLARGVSIAMPGDGDHDAEEIRALLEARRPQLAAALELQQIEFSAISYASLSDAEIDRYIGFAESPAGQRYHAASAIAVDKAMTAAAIEAGRLVGGEKSA